SYREAAELSAAAMELGTVLPVHIKVDTGMSRMGFSLHDRDGAVRQIEDATRLPGIVAKGIYTHFASADFDGDEDGIYTRAQFAKMRELLDSLKSRTVRFEMRHCCNSAATVAYPEMHMDMVRVGIVLYGLAPSTHIKSRIMLRPALSLKSAAALVKTLEPGDTVSYGRTFEVTRPTVAAILPIGYADGYLREFGGKAQALINGKRAAVIGRVCMDQCVIDVTDIEGVRPGDVATLIGRQNRDEITVDDLAEIAGCINYQTVCLITDRIPRVYFEDGKKIGAEGPML
ncbi:MAG TPA: alanine racemase, partial [Ruminococcaceae bacterium]|nr:alanine racemase [Oscillospiraceae bacterium]